MTNNEFIEFLKSIGDFSFLDGCAQLLKKRPEQRQQLVDFIKENNLTCFNVGEDVTAYKNYRKIADKAWELYKQSGGKVYIINERIR